MDIRIFKTTLKILAITCCSLASAKPSSATFDSGAQQMLASHYLKYKNAEYFSAISLSVNLPNEKIKNYYVGYTSHQANAPAITASTLFQIGSITKSFTAAIMLQLEKEGKFKLSDPIKHLLLAYPKWGDITVEQLLNMTSGLPNYSDTPLWNTQEYQHPTHTWSNQQLIDFVYPTNSLNPPRKSGYFYTNTGYILADMIVQKVTLEYFASELERRMIKPANLMNTFYPLPTMSSDLAERLAHGYNYNQYDNPALVGQDAQTNNLSWAGAAGGLISTSEDITKWVKALFIDETILDKTQKISLTRMVSVNTGKPIKQTSENEPRGFGLGVIQSYDKSIGRFWFYEGETLGYRALYMYVPCNQVIISSIFNSATNSENDHSKELMLGIYQLALQNHPKLACQTSG